MPNRQEKCVVNCKICNELMEYVFSAVVLSKYPVKYYRCGNCEYICTEQAYWLNEAYRSSINISDTGIMQRNVDLSKISSLVIYFFFDKKGVFLDYAGGYGIFVRMMRDIGFDFYWMDKYSENLVARGFEGKHEVKYELLTSFESFEHFEHPIKEIEEMLCISDSILFSTDLYSGVAPDPKTWDYYGLNHGQHISFYSYKTLHYISRKYGIKLYSNGKNFHIFTSKKINQLIFVILRVLNKIGFSLLVKKCMKTKIIYDYKQLQKS